MTDKQSVISVAKDAAPKTDISFTADLEVMNLQVIDSSVSMMGIS